MQKSAARAVGTLEQDAPAELKQPDAGFIAGLVERLDASIKASLEAPSADRNEAYQIALCRSLATLFPERVGVCRGFLIDGEGRTAGDGIVLLNIERFPTLRDLGRDPLKKVGAPADAAVAYIETRASLDLRETSPSLLQALQGVAAVRKLSRASALPSVAFSEADIDAAPASLLYCAVWASTVLLEEGAIPARALELRMDTLRRGRIPRRELPDALGAGSLLMMPALVEDGSGRRHRRPFNMPGTELTFTGGPRALGPSIMHLAWALSIATRETPASSHTSSGVYPRAASGAAPSIDALSDKIRIA
jgi:hypothetical protein